MLGLWNNITGHNLQAQLALLHDSTGKDSTCMDCASPRQAHASGSSALLQERNSAVTCVGHGIAQSSFCKASYNFATGNVIALPALGRDMLGQDLKRARVD